MIKQPEVQMAERGRARRWRGAYAGDVTRSWTLSTQVVRHSAAKRHSHTAAKRLRHTAA